MEKYHEGWVEILPSHAFKLPDEEEKKDFFNISFLRELIEPSTTVKYLPETIRVIRDHDGDKTAWIQAVNENMETRIFPLYALGFSKEQKRELILRKRIPKKYFNRYNLVSSFN